MLKLAMNWSIKLKGKLGRAESLKNHTTLRIGGRARYFVEPASIQELRLVLSLAKKQKVQVLILGAGSNLLVSDRGLDAMVIRLSAPCFKKVIFKEKSVEAGAGVRLAQLIVAAAGRSLGGHEFLAGIPGTLGGAIMMNAGQSQKGRSTADLIDRVMVMDYNGNIKIIPKNMIKFGYHSSGLDKYIILNAFLKFKRNNKNRIKDSIKKYLVARRQSQDLLWPSAGCVFRNPYGDSAGRLIELAGLKGKRVGGAQVSLRHANFIINRQAATCRDVLRLMQLVKKEVKNKFGVGLEPEVKIWQR